jgi:hypothetical protein
MILMDDGTILMRNRPSVMDDKTNLMRSGMILMDDETVPLWK